MSAVVRYLDPEPNGLATMVGGLIEASLERDAGRAAKLRPTVVTLDVSDVDVAITLRLEPRLVRVADGLGSPAHLRVRTDSEMLLQLATVPLRLGLPDVSTPRGRAVIRALLSRRLSVKGLLRHPRRLAMVTSLISVD